MDSIDAFHHCLASVKALLKSRGFSASGTTFRKLVEGNWMVVNLQSSQGNTREEKKFTLNLGICSEAIRVFQEFDISKKPTVWDCHLQARIGNLHTPRQDYWWVVNHMTDSKALELQVCNEILQFGLPFLANHASDHQLIEHWLGLVNMEGAGVMPFEHLTILMKVHGIGDLNAVAEKMLEYAKGRPHEFAAKYHLKELGIQVSK